MPAWHLAEALRLFPWVPHGSFVASMSSHCRPQKDSIEMPRRALVNKKRPGIGKGMAQDRKLSLLGATTATTDTRIKCWYVFTTIQDQ